MDFICHSYSYNQSNVKINKYALTFYFIYVISWKYKIKSELFHSEHLMGGH